MKKIRKGATHGLKAVGGSFMDADLKVHIKNVLNNKYEKKAYCNSTLDR